MDVVGCGIHGFAEHVGIDVDEFRVFWKLEAAAEDVRQVAYQVVVSTSRDVDPAGAPCCFDSGRMESHEQRNVVVKPARGFASTTWHFWTVTIWDQQGCRSTSAVSEFYTSYPRSSRLLPPYSMNQTYMPHSSLIFRPWFEDEANRWKAVWIGDGSDKPIYLRKAFSLRGKPTRAVVLATGLGHFSLSVNGQPASCHVLDPGWTDYHRTVQFVGYDVTDKLQEGANAIGAHVGNGFYAGDQGDRFFWPMYEDRTYIRHGNELCFFAEVHLEYADGSRECILSGPSWKVRRSATTLANIYASEDHDRRAYPAGWDAPGFDDEQWAAAKPLTGPRGKLRYQSQPPVALHDLFEPVDHKLAKPGCVVYDLGQNSSIVVKVEASGPSGASYRVRYSETIGDDGMVLMPDPLFKDFETKVYSVVSISQDGAREVWSPDFSFTSARYIQVETSSDAVVVHSVTARHISSAARRLGFVETDKDDVNALIKACYWTFSSNIFSYHTDCPQIEKFGWLEVSALLLPATQYARDMEAVYCKMLDDMADAQEPSGLVPTMAPLYRYMAGPMHDTISWGGAVCLLPELIKRYYGTTAVFARAYPSCVRYMEYMRTKERRGGLIEHGLGDWGRDIAHGNHQANIETAVYHQCLKNVALMARELGLGDDEARFEAWARRVYDVYNSQLLVTDSRTAARPYAFYTSLDEPGVRDRTMVAQAVALQFDMVPAAHRDDVLAAFLDAADESGHVMLAGEIGLKHLWTTLAEADRPDIVLAMARQAEHPSYMRFLRRGETSLCEFWQDDCRSKCHDMLGTIYEWFYAYALGVTPVADGYRSWRLKPCFAAEFDRVDGEVESPYGLISVRFARDARRRHSAVLHVTVPAGTTCELVLPADTSVAEVWRGDEIRPAIRGRSGELRQGTYRLEITA